MGKISISTLSLTFIPNHNYLTKHYSRKMKCWSHDHFRSQLTYFVTACSHYTTHTKIQLQLLWLNRKHTQKSHQMLKIFFFAEVCILVVASQKLSFLIINISSFRCSICRTSLRMSFDFPPKHNVSKYCSGIFQLIITQL